MYNELWREVGLPPLGVERVKDKIRLDKYTWSVYNVCISEVR